MASSSRRAAPLLAAIAFLSISPLSRAAPVLSWVSEPVGSGETALILGDGFDSSSFVTLSTTSSWLPLTNVTLAPLANQTTAGTLKFSVPPTFPLDAWSVTVTSGGVSSAPYILNAARPWWVQGDVGDAATPGGWLRVFGLGVAAVDPATAALETQLREATRAATLASSGAAGGDDSAFGAAADAVAALRAALRTAPPSNCTLRLSPVGGGAPIDVHATSRNASTWSAYFALPASSQLPAGEYAVSVSNGRGVSGGFTPLNSFVSSDAPHVSTVHIVPPRAWPGAARFTVGVRSLPCHMPCETSDAALAGALAAAAAAGGGTVFFPRGQYFLADPVVVPPNTVLAGERMDLVALYAAEYETPVGAPPALFSLSLPQNGSATGSWGVQDLTLFVSGFHNIVFDANNVTDGFFLRRVRTRVNAFFGANEEFTSTRGRWQNFTWGSNGAVLMVNGRNWEVTDCDLYATATVISSQRSSCRNKVWPGECHASYYGYVARNRLWNGAAAHVMNQWMQVIFEQNAIVGTSLFVRSSVNVHPHLATSGR